MPETVGQAKVEVSADVSRAENALVRLQADFDRSMAEIGRKSAEAKVGADITALERKLVEAKRELKTLEDSKAEVSVGGDIKQWEIAVARVKEQIRELNLQKAEITVDAHQLRDANRETQLADSRLKQMARSSDQAMAASKRLEQAKAAETKTIRDYSVAQGRAIAEDSRRTETTLKNAVAVDKLRASYSKMQAEQKTMVPGNIFDRLFGNTDAEKSRLSELDNEMKLTENRIKNLGGDLRNLDGSGSGGNLLSRIGRWVTGFTKMRLQLGPLSGTILQFGTALAALGPILLSLAGGAGALIGVVGTGLVGALSVAGTAAAGFGLSAAGIGLAIKPAITQLQQGMAASKAYSDAVLKYGKGSTQAATASKNLASTLKGVSPAARSAIKDFGGVGAAWEKLTAPTRSKFFDLVGQGLRTVSALMPTFAHQTNATMGVLTTGVTKWFQALRSPAGKSAISGLMSDFRSMLPGLLAGFGNLVTVFANIARTAGRFLGPIGQGFQQWTAHLAAATGAGTGFSGKLSTMIHQAGDLVHLFGAAGKALLLFFSAGAGSGDKMVRELTRTINGWNRWMQSIGGQNSLHQFFATGAQDTSNFFQALAPVVSSFVHLLHVLQPITSGILAFAAALAGVVGWIGQFKVLKGLLAGIGVVIGASFVVSKIAGWVSAVKGAAAAVEALAIKWGLVAAAEDTAAAGAVAAGGTEVAAAGTAAATSTVAGAGGATAAIGGVTVAEGGAASAAAGLTSALAVIVPPVAITALAALAVTQGQVRTAFEESIHATREQIKASRAYGGALPPITDTVRRSRELLTATNKGAAAAQTALTVAERRYGVGSPQAVAAAKNLVNVQQAQITSQNALKVTTQDQLGLQQRKHAADLASLRDARSAVAQAHSAAKAAAGSWNATSDQAAAAKKLAAAQKNLSQAEAAAAISSGKLLLSHINLARAQQGLLPISQNLAGALGQVAAAIGKAAATKLGNIVNPAEAQKAINLANSLDNLGQGKTVHDVVVNSTGAKQTIAELQHVQAITIRDKTLRFKQQGLGLVLAGIQAITGARLPTKTQKFADSGSNFVLSKLGALAGFILPTKTQKVQASMASVFSSLASLAATVLPPLIQPVILGKPHHAEGGLGIKLPGPLSRDQQGLAVQNSGGSSKVTRPSMVVGEEAPAHPEFVIATNPAYRDSNVLYLDQAAESLGYAIVPAYAGGKGHKHHHHGGGKPPKGAGPKPITPEDILGSTEFTSGYDSLHAQITAIEDAFTTSQNEMTLSGNWDYNSLIAMKMQEQAIYGSPGDKTDATLEGWLYDAINNIFPGYESAKTQVKNLPAQIKTATKAATSLQNAAGKHPKNHHLKSAAAKAQSKVNRLQNQLSNAQSTVSSAPSQLEQWALEYHYTNPAAVAALGADIDSLKKDAGLATAADAAQPGIFNAARQDLYRQFASNAIAIIGSGTTTRSPVTPGLNTPGFAAGSTGIDVSGVGSVSSSGNQPGPGGQGDTIINMTNTFANVPPDPHSWSRQAAFELQTI